MRKNIAVPRPGLVPRFKLFSFVAAFLRRLFAPRPRPASRKQMRLLHSLCGSRGAKLRGVCKSRTGRWPDQLTARGASALIRRLLERPPRRSRAKRPRRSRS